MNSIPTWQLVLEAARDLDRTAGEFRLDQIVRAVQRHDPSRGRSTIQPTVQGMTANAGAGPPSPCGTPLRRISHGRYALEDEQRVTDTTSKMVPASAGVPRDDRADRSPEVCLRQPVLLTGSVNLTDVMGDLPKSRPVFHSEADFQFALAWAVQQRDPDMRVRLETRPTPGAHLDLELSRFDTGLRTFVELKYLTCAWSGVVDRERFNLAQHSARDIRSYDVVKDLCRVEQFVAAKPRSDGVVIVLANDAGYWNRPRTDRATFADAFRIHEGSILSGIREWLPGTGRKTAPFTARERVAADRGAVSSLT